MTQDILAFPQMAMLSEEQCETIHLASLEILRRTGVRVYHEAALELLRQTDAIVAGENLVRPPPGLVEWALAGAPSRITLCRRGSDEAAVRLEGREVNFGTGSDCPNYLDPRTKECRPFTVDDVVGAIHVVDALPELGFCMSMGIPSDLAGANPYRHQFALMLQHTTKPIVFVCDDRADCEAITHMAAAATGGVEPLQINPTLLLYSEPSTPLKHSKTATDKLLYMAEHALPIVHSPAPMMGGTAPVTLAGALALGNAEVLSSLVMHQLTRPGAPFVYGQGLHHMDMKTTISVYGAPEFQLARVLVAEMGRFYRLPTWGYAGQLRQLCDGRAGRGRRRLLRADRAAERGEPGARRGLPGGRADHLAGDDRLYRRDDIDNAPLCAGNLPGCRVVGSGRGSPGGAGWRLSHSSTHPPALSRSVATGFDHPAAG